MDSADRGLISWPGSNATEAVRFRSIRRVTDCAITCFHSRKLAARPLEGQAANAALR
jgi:hypothetical protein